MESPVRELPIPTIGAPPPVKVVADWLLTPPDVPVDDETVEPEGLELDPAGPEDVPGDDEFDDDVDGPRLKPPEPAIPVVGAAPPTVEVPPGPPETIEEAAPRPPAPPGRPLSGWPKKPFTVVFASPWWINFFENDGLAQFDHRLGAYLVAAFAAWIYLKGIKLSGYAKTSAKAITIIVAWQIFLGITTLLLMAPVWLSALHQVTAACLLGAAVWHAYEIRIHPIEV